MAWIIYKGQKIPVGEICDFTDYTDGIEEANFEDHTFDEWANFEGVLFKGPVNFRRAVFMKGCSFKGARFHTHGHDVDFEEAVFLAGSEERGKLIDFSKAQFGLPSSFQAGDQRIYFKREDEKNYICKRPIKPEKKYQRDHQEFNDYVFLKVTLDTWNLSELLQKAKQSHANFTQSPSNVKFSNCRFGRVNLSELTKDTIEEHIEIAAKNHNGYLKYRLEESYKQFSISGKGAEIVKTHFASSILLYGDKKGIEELRLHEPLQVSFVGAQFHNGGDANFLYAQFHNGEYASFSGAQFHNGGNASFNKAQFHNGGDAYFGETQFHNGGDASFRQAQFHNGGSAIFWGAQFRNGGDAYFDETRFRNGGDASFRQAQFHNSEDTSFSEARFHNGGNADFQQAQFHNGGNASFRQAQFYNGEDTSFLEAQFRCKSINLSGIGFLSMGRLSWAGAQFGETLDLFFDDCLFICRDGVSFQNARFPEKGSVRFRRSFFSSRNGVSFNNTYFRSATFEGGEYP